MPPNARRAAELLVADVRRLRVLVDDLMELSRFDARAERAELERVDLGSAVRAIVAARLPGADVDTPPDPVVVAADVRRLDRIVGNLLDNARDHAGEASVSVSVDTDGGEARLGVADRGPGVQPGALEHLFDRFYKADPSRHGGGSGLGLAIAAEHAALLGGSLGAANRAGGGLEVTLRLPVTGSLPERDGPDTDVRRTPPGRPASRGPQHAPCVPPPKPSNLLAALALLAAACSPASWPLGAVATPPPSEQPSLDRRATSPPPRRRHRGPTSSGAHQPPARPREATSPSPTSTGTTTVRAYFFLGSFSDNAGLVPVLREIPRTPAVGAAAMTALLAGPNDAELGARPAMYTTIPEGTRFLGLRIDAGVATVNLSREFEGGGGSASILGRLAQVVYTLTQFPTVQSVRFELDGAPVTVFSGEGVVLDQPVGRADYTDQLPAVFVDRPAWGGVLGSPARLVGMANVFEATFRVRILDGAGHKLADTPAMATCGTGCWGTFDVTVPYASSRQRAGGRFRSTSHPPRTGRSRT